MTDTGCPAFPSPSVTRSSQPGLTRRARFAVLGVNCRRRWHRAGSGGTKLAYDYLATKPIHDPRECGDLAESQRHELTVHCSGPIKKKIRIAASHGRFISHLQRI